MRRLVRLAEGGPPELDPRTTTLDVARYVDPAELAREQATLFTRRPVIVAHTSEIENVGDFVTADVGGVPLVVLRSEEGVRTFVNACRHRGARIVEESAGCQRVLTCPYHAWSYRLDGSLRKIPGEAAFASVDHSERGLVPVPCEARHGFVWAQLRGELDLASFLGPTLDDDFEAFGLDGYREMKRSVRETRANWKLVMDAFAEGYHLSSLHARSLARFFLDVATVDDCTPHVRQVGARKTLLEVKDDETRWDFRAHTTPFYDVFPNTVLVFHPHWLSALTLFPLAPDRVRVVHRMLVPGSPPDQVRDKLEQSFAHIDGMVFEAEDLRIAESIQSTLASGANTDVLLGALEEGMRIFHAARDRALAEADAET